MLERRRSARLLAGRDREIPGRRNRKRLQRWSLECKGILTWVEVVVVAAAVGLECDVVVEQWCSQYVRLWGRGRKGGGVVAGRMAQQDGRQAEVRTAGGRVASWWKNEVSKYAMYVVPQA